MTNQCNNNFDQMKHLISEVSSRNKNEAETRHKIIDFVLNEFLSWPRNRIEVEKYINPGYADYILKKENGGQLLFIEAKKEGVFFELPITPNKGKHSYHKSIKKLISDDNIKTAMYQVRNYCLDTGCEYACITNGHEWIFFKIFEKGKRWEDLQAFVIISLDYFISEYTKAINNFSFTAVTDNSSLPSLLTSLPPKDREIFYPKEKIVSYSHTINANRLASTLRPIATHYFGVIGDDETDFMHKCYVSQREYKTTFSGIHTLIHDSLSPYFESYGVQQLDDTGKGGKLGGRLSKNIKKSRKGEVLVLFGGKGAGKSTFIKRLLHHIPPKWLKDHSTTVIVDLLKTPEKKDVIREYIWQQIINQLDTDKVLDSDRDTLIKKLFPDRWAIATKQDLFGLDKKSDTYNLKLNDLISKWKNDYIYCSKRLVKYWEEYNKGVIIVIDNTDQYSTEIQDYCFTTAQEISNELNCVTLISMREERFYDSKIHGVLDAFQNSGFHISSPDPSEVFKKRIMYTISLLENKKQRSILISDKYPDAIKDCNLYLRILHKEFNDFKSPLTSFLRACSHGDTRLSLDLFRSFLLSGYTNVDEMILAGRWNFQIHQVLKPVMIPNRYFYDELLSDIPNIFQLRSNRHSSHFTALRILRKISKGSNKTAPAYHSISKLKAYFSEVFNMTEDFEKNIDVLLKHGFIESDNRLDYYSSRVDSIKVTNYGLYMIKDLAFYFTYLDLICTDCGVFSQKDANYITESARKEFALFNRGERLEKIKVRLERVEVFIDYLSKEEQREKELYSLDMKKSDMFTCKMDNEFKSMKLVILRSAKKYKNKHNVRNKYNHC